MMMLVVPRLSARRLSVGGLRLYEVGGALYPSVTTILGVVSKPGLVAWARRTALEAVRELLAQGLSIEEALQLAAYAIALEEMTGQEVAAAYVVGLREEGYEARRVALGAAKEGFLGALSLWRALQGELYG